MPAVKPEPTIVKSHDHGPRFASEYPSYVTLKDTAGRDVTFMFVPNPEKPQSVTLTIDHGEDWQIVVKSMAHDAIQLASFIREAAKAARHPDGMRVPNFVARQLAQKAKETAQ